MPARPIATGRFALELGGATAGWLVSANGGLAVADVVTLRDGKDTTVRKHIGSVRYDDLRLAGGADVAPEFCSWLSSALAGKHTRKSGAVLRVDAMNRVVERLEFENALLAEVAFPALDGSSKEAAVLSARLSPGSARRRDGDGGRVQAAAKPKAWVRANFRLAIDGLDCSKVVSVEPLVVRTVVADTQAGEERFRQIVPTVVEIGDLVVRFAESGARDMYAWHEDFVVNGNCGDDREKSGTLELLSPAGAEVVLTLTFGGLGIYKLTRAAAAADAVPIVTASMYCETLAVAPT